MSNSTEVKTKEPAQQSAELQSIVSKKEAKEKGLNRYFNGVPCKYGHIAWRVISSDNCKECKVDYDKKRRNSHAKSIAKYMKTWIAENKEIRSVKSKKYREENKEKVLAQKNKYHHENKVKIAQKKRERYNNNPEFFREKSIKWGKDNKEKANLRSKQYHKENPEGAAARNLLLRVFNNWKGGRHFAEKALGYTYSELKSRIESQFVGGMCWEHRSEFHIDHIKPVSLFLKEGITDPKIINALSNLQPLWAFDNQSKGAKYND